MTTGAPRKEVEEIINRFRLGKAGPEVRGRYGGWGEYGGVGVHGAISSAEDYWNIGAAMGVPFVDIGEELADVRSQVDSLSYGIKSLKTEVLYCKECINRISEELNERPVVKGTWLLDIDEDIEVLQAIPIVIEETEEEVVASFAEVEVFATGSCEAEAINALKLEIRDLFFDLEASSQEELGKLPKVWKRVLEKVIKRVGAT